MLRTFPVLALVLVACGTSLPARYVIERDVGDYAYRRYQKVLDVEFPVQENDAVGHTATYVLRHGDDVRYITAFVTVYDQPRGLVAEVRERIERLGTYDVAVEKRDGAYMWKLVGGEGTWLLWVSGTHLVKLGSPDGPVPEDLVETYVDLYESDLDEHGRAEDGAASAGPSRQEAEERDELDIPDSLREGAPR